MQVHFGEPLKVAGGYWRVRRECPTELESECVPVIPQYQRLFGRLQAVTYY